MDFKQVFKKLTNQKILPPPPKMTNVNFFFLFFLKASLISKISKANIQCPIGINVVWESCKKFDRIKHRVKLDNDKRVTMG